MSLLIWLIILLSVVDFILLLLLLFYFLRFRNHHHNHKFLKKRKGAIRIFPNSIFLKDSYKLLACYHYQKNNKPFLVFIQSVGSHLHELEWLQNFCLKSDYSYLFFSQRYSGVNAPAKSNNEYNFAENIEDCQEILLFLLDKHPDKKIVAIGQGLGAAILIKIADHNGLQSNRIQFGLINIATKKDAIDQQFLDFSNSYCHLLKLSKNNILNITSFFKPRFYPLFVTCKQGCTNSRYISFFDYAHFNRNNSSLVLKYMKEHKFNFVEWSIHYFLFYYNFASQALEKIDKITKNKIIFFQGKEDYMWDDQILKKYSSDWKNQKNISLIYIENLKNNFSLQNEKANQIIFQNKILPHFE